MPKSFAYYPPLSRRAMLTYTDTESEEGLDNSTR